MNIMQQSTLRLTRVLSSKSVELLMMRKIVEQNFKLNTMPNHWMQRSNVNKVFYWKLLIAKSISTPFVWIVCVCVCVCVGYRLKKPSLIRRCLTPAFRMARLETVECVQLTFRVIEFVDPRGSRWSSKWFIITNRRMARIERNYLKSFEIDSEPANEQRTIWFKFSHLADRIQWSRLALPPILGLTEFSNARPAGILLYSSVFWPIASRFYF